MKKDSSISKGKYRHYKGNLYEVIDIAKHSESLEDMVIYRTLYGDFGIWVRPLQMFLENVEVNGNIQKRFEFIGDELSNAIHTDVLKSDHKLFEATLDQAEILNTKIDKFNAEQLSFVGNVKLEKNYLIKDQRSKIKEIILLLASKDVFTSENACISTCFS